MALPITLALLAGGCGVSYDAARAMPPYPMNLHTIEVEDSEGFIVEMPIVEDMQVFRNGVRIEIFNSTPRRYDAFTLWLNQRYGRAVDQLEAGGSVELSLWDFYDQWGESFKAGGVWRAFEPDPVRLVQIQRNDEDPLIGLVTVWERED